MTRRGIRLEFTTALVEHISAVGFSPRYGARPLQRAVERHVVGALSRLLIDEAIANVCVVCDYADEVKLTIR